MAGKQSREIGRLSARRVATITKPGRYHDGLGLYLQVTESGTRSWLYRYATGTGKRRSAHWMGLGSAHTFTLAEARLAVADCRRQRWAGKDPIGARRAGRLADKLEQAKAVTFRAAAELYISAHEAGWRNAKHAGQWKATLQTYCYPIFGDVPVQDVDVTLVTKAVEPIWTTKTETASRLRGRIESVLDWATARGHRTGDNPARWRGHLENLLPKRSRVARVEHYPALAYADVGAFMKVLRKQEGTAAVALEYLILTATRTSETIGAMWSEIDMDAALWTIPAERIKASREHRVPLSAPALAILKRMAEIRQGDAMFVFPGGKAARPLSHTAILKVLERMGRSNITTHGFRATFRTWAAERMPTVPREIAEQCLAHTTAGAVEQAYQRSDHFERRRHLMQAWAAWCAKPAEATGVVVSIRSVGSGPA